MDQITTRLLDFIQKFSATMPSAALEILKEEVRAAIPTQLIPPLWSAKHNHAPKGWRYLLYGLNFTDCCRIYCQANDMWEDAFHTWRDSAIKHADRPSPAHLVGLSWELETTKSLLNGDGAAFRLHSFHDLVAWEHFARNILLRWLQIEPVRVRFVTCETPTRCHKPGQAMPLFKSPCPKRDTPAELPQFDFPEFVTRFGFLTESEPLSASQKRMCQGLSIVSTPIVHERNSFFKSVVKTTWQAMRWLYYLAAIPPEPQLSEAPSEYEINSIFDLVLNWIGEVERSPQPLPYEARVFMGDKAIILRDIDGRNTRRTKTVVPVDPDGPCGISGFRLGGQLIDFGRASLQRRLLIALWDRTKGVPAASRPITEVISEVYGDDDAANEERKIRSICFQVRSKLEAANCPKTIEFSQGHVRLANHPEQ